MAKKLVALFILCIVVVSMVHIGDAHFDEIEAKVEAEFKECFNTCLPECKTGGGGQSFCEVKCETDCEEKEEVAKLDAYTP